MNTFSTNQNNQFNASSILNFSTQIVDKYKHKYSENVILIFNESILSDLMPTMEIVTQNVLRKNPTIDKKIIESVLNDLSYSDIITFLNGLKSVLEIMKFSHHKQFFNLFLKDGEVLRKKINQLKIYHPRVIKYLNFIFRKCKDWQDHFYFSDELESNYENFYFLKIKNEFINGNIFFTLFNKRTQNFVSKFV